MQTKNTKLTHILLFVFLPFTCGYFLTAFFNQVNAVLASYIVKSISLTAGQLGIMTSVYLLLFALAQIPLGILLDRFGPRRVQTVLFIIAAIGMTLFALAPNAMVLLIGRALIGLGMAGGLMAAFKAVRAWFPHEKIPLINGCLMALGTLGALCSTVPVELLLVFITWRELILCVVVLTLLIAAMIFFIVPDDLQQKSPIRMDALLKSLGHIYKEKYFWRLAPLAATTFACNMAMVGLWAGPWFTDVAHFSTYAAAHHLLVISVALIMGIALSGYVADRLMLRFNIRITTIISAGLFIFILIQLLILFGPAPGSYLLWFLFGFLSRSTTLSYAAMAQYFEPQYAGRATTALNLLFFMAAFIVQYAIGVVVDQYGHTLQGGYPPIAYHVAFAAVIGIQVVALLWFFVFPTKKALNDLPA